MCDSMTIDGEIQFHSPKKRDNAEISFSNNSPRYPLNRLLADSSEYGIIKNSDTNQNKNATDSNNSKPTTPKTPRSSQPSTPRTMNPPKDPRITPLPLHKTFSSLKSFAQEDPSSPSSKAFSGGLLNSLGSPSPAPVIETNKKPEEKVDLYPTPTKSFAPIILKRENLDESDLDESNLDDEDFETSTSSSSQIARIVVQPEKKPFIVLKKSRLVLHAHGIFHDQRKNEIISLVSLKQFRFFKSIRRLSVIVKKGSDKSFRELSLSRWGQQPSDRVHACSCYNQTHSSLFVFGGIHVEEASNSNETNPLFLNDLWCFRKKKWIQILQCSVNDPQNSIPSIQHARMVCREKNDLISLYIFGGVCPSSPGKEASVSSEHFHGMLIIEIGNLDTQPSVVSIQTIPVEPDLYPRIGHSFIYHPKSDSIIVYGGQNSSGQIIDDFWKYNCFQRKWKEFTRLMNPLEKSKFLGLSFHAECLVGNNDSQILFLGGKNSMNDDNYGLIFDLKTEKYHIPQFLSSIGTSTDSAASSSTKGSLSYLFPRHFHSMCRGFTNNSILVFGGKQISSKNKLPAIVWLFMGKEINPIDAVRAPTNIFYNIPPPKINILKNSSMQNQFEEVENQKNVVTISANAKQFLLEIESRKKEPIFEENEIQIEDSDDEEAVVTNKGPFRLSWNSKSGPFV